MKSNFAVCLSSLWLIALAFLAIVAGQAAGKGPEPISDMTVSRTQDDLQSIQGSWKVVRIVGRAPSGSGDLAHCSMRMSFDAKIMTWDLSTIHVAGQNQASYGAQLSGEFVIDPQKG